MPPSHHALLVLVLFLAVQTAQVVHSVIPPTIYLFATKDSYTAGSLGSREQTTNICFNTMAFYNYAFRFQCVHVYSLLRYSTDPVEVGIKDPLTNTAIGGTVVRGPTGTQIAGNWSLFEEASRFPTSGVVLDNSLVDANAAGGTVWLGLPAGGSPVQDNCADWKSTAGQATYGDASKTTGLFTGLTASCALPKMPFICVCNTDPALPAYAQPTAHPSQPTSIMFQASAIFAGHASRHWGAVMSSTGALKMLGDDHANELGNEAYFISSIYDSWGNMKSTLGNHLPFTILP